MIYSLTRDWLHVNKFYASKQSNTIGRFYAGKYVQAVKRYGRIKLRDIIDWSDQASESESMTIGM